MFPVEDWQFYAVTVMTILAVGMLLRSIVGRPKKGGCASCDSGAGKQETRNQP